MPLKQHFSNLTSLQSRGTISYRCERFLLVAERTEFTSLTVRFWMTLQVKCDQYWPSRGTETYGVIQVTMLDTLELATYSVRTFSLYKVRSIQTMIVDAV